MGTASAGNFVADLFSVPLAIGGLVLQSYSAKWRDQDRVRKGEALAPIRFDARLDNGDMVTVLLSGYDQTFLHQSEIAKLRSGTSKIDLKETVRFSSVDIAACLDLVIDGRESELSIFFARRGDSLLIGIRGGGADGESGTQLAQPYPIAKLHPPSPRPAMTDVHAASRALMTVDPTGIDRQLADVPSAVEDVTVVVRLGNGRKLPGKLKGYAVHQGHYRNDRGRRIRDGEEVGLDCQFIDQEVLWGKVKLSLPQPATVCWVTLLNHDGSWSRSFLWFALDETGYVAPNNVLVLNEALQLAAPTTTRQEAGGSQSAAAGIAH